MRFISLNHSFGFPSMILKILEWGSVYPHNLSAWIHIATYALAYSGLALKYLTIV